MSAAESATPVESDAYTAALVRALQRNVQLVGELAARYGVEILPERDRDAPQVASPGAIDRLLGVEMRALAQEQVRVLLVDTDMRVRGQRVIYQGNCRCVDVRVAEILRPAVVAGVPSIIVAHNHPSGNPQPSAQDVQMTSDLLEGGRLLGITVVDHVVIGDPEIVSFNRDVWSKT